MFHKKQATIVTLMMVLVIGFVYTTSVQSGGIAEISRAVNAVNVAGEAIRVVNVAGKTIKVAEIAEALQKAGMVVNIPDGIAVAKALKRDSLWEEVLKRTNNPKSNLTPEVLKKGDVQPSVGPVVPQKDIDISPGVPSTSVSPALHGKTELERLLEEYQRYPATWLQTAMTGLRELNLYNAWARDDTELISAVKTFQEQHQISVDGKLSRSLLKRIEQERIHYQIRANLDYTAKAIAAKQVVNF